MSLEWLTDELTRLQGENLLRRARCVTQSSGAWVEINGRRLRDASSNDYLALSGHPAIRKAAYARPWRARCSGTSTPAPSRPTAGEVVTVASRRGSIALYARADPGTPRGAVFVPFAFYEAAANVLTNPALDPFGKIPEFKYCAVRLSRGGSPPADPGYGKGRALAQTGG